MNKAATCPVVPRDNRKWETIRRLRYGALIKLFNTRYARHGYVFPDDHAGRDDLWLLVSNTSLAAAEPQKKMRHVIELWAPWMTVDEAERYIKHVWGLDIYERTETSAEIGRRLGLTNAERQALKLWPFKPIDATDDEIEAQRKARRQASKLARRRANGVKPRAPSKKPWTAMGISKATYYRQRETPVVPTIVTGVEPELSHSKQAESQRRGYQQEGGMERPREALRKEKNETREPPSSPRLEPFESHIKQEKANG
jgi:hypothetical protein